MKKYISRSIIAIVVIGFAVSTSSCKKDKNPAIENQKKKISDIIPQKYLDTLIRLGITIHEGTTPPIVNGIYLASPTNLVATNIVGDIIGTTFLDVKIKLSDQNNSDFSLRLLGKQLLASNDTSIITAISGSGSNFTIYGKVKATALNSNSAIFAIIISGSISTDGIVNFEEALINIDNSNGGISFIPEGKGRLVKDGNNLASITTVFRTFNSPISNKKALWQP